MNASIYPTAAVSSMASPASTLTEEAFALVDPAWHSIATFQFAPLVERLQLQEGLTPEQAQQAFFDTKQFMYLCAHRQADGSQSMVPPAPIDAAWHHFILFTSAYSEFCDTHIGRFIHHRPYTQSERAANHADGDGLKGLKASIAFAKDAFGSLSSNWCEHLLSLGTSQADGASNDQCGGGTTNCQAPYK